MQTSYFTNSLGYQQLTSLGAAVALTIPVGTTVAVIQCETQNVRYRDDGVNPTSTVGMLMKTTDGALVYTGPMNRLKFIEATAGGVLNVTYYGNAPSAN